VFDSEGKPLTFTPEGKYTNADGSPYIDTAKGPGGLQLYDAQGNFLSLWSKWKAV